MTPTGWWRAALAGTLVVSSCRGSEGAVPPPPSPPQVVDVEMRDYSFVYDADIAGGRVLFRVRNAGPAVHSLTVLPLTDDIPPIDAQLRGSERRGFAPFAGVGPQRAGSRTSFAVDLRPGLRYAFVCFLPDAQGTSHALKGMSTEFRARGREGAPGASTTSVPSG